MTGQNTSPAVMQRRSEPHDSLDDFPTPPWATRALCEWLVGQGEDLAAFTCREPAANRGHMVRPLTEYFRAVWASDVHDYGAENGGGFPQRDYLFGPPPPAVDWTITNPPFRLGEQFIARALDTSRVGVAILARTAFLETDGRHRRLFGITPPAFVLQFAERVVIHKGRLAPEGSSATAYAWLIWLTGESDTRLRWIPEGTRARLERTGDYPPEPTAPAPVPLFEDAA